MYNTFCTLWQPISHLRLVQYLPPDVRGLDLVTCHITWPLRSTVIGQWQCHVTFTLNCDWSMTVGCNSDWLSWSLGVLQEESLAILFHLIVFVLVVVVVLFLFLWWEADWIGGPCTAVMWNFNIIIRLFGCGFFVHFLAAERTCDLELVTARYTVDWPA